jgi:hypothetical protein
LIEPPASPIPTIGEPCPRSLKSAARVIRELPRRVLIKLAAKPSSSADVVAFNTRLKRVLKAEGLI